MNLFERLLYSRLCNEQPVDGGAAPAASEQSAPAGDNPAPVGDHAKQEGENNLLLMVINLLLTKSLKTISRMKKRTAINQRVRLRSTSFRLPKA